MQINKGVDLFENYNDVVISPDTYVQESLYFFKLGFEELDYFNKMNYDAMKHLDAKESLENVSYAKNVTIFFENQQDKNYTLRQTVEMMISVALSVYDIPIKKYSENIPEINWLLNNTNNRVRANIAVEGGLVGPQVDQIKIKILDQTNSIEMIILIGIGIAAIFKFVLYSFLYASKQRLCTTWYYFSD